MGYRAQGDFYNEAMHIDIVLMNETEFIPIELKYKTKGIEKELSKELYKFKHYGAYPDNCCRYIEDIRRIKRLKEHRKFKAGYAIFLTDDEKYVDIFKCGYVGRKKKICLDELDDRKFYKLKNGYFCVINEIENQEVSL